MQNAFRNIDVFILCGGFGRRLKAISRQTPKPMLKIGDSPFLDIIIDYMAYFGFRRFILGTYYKAGVIEKYYNHSHKYGLKILFSRERVPLDTGGAVKNAKGIIESNLFFVLNGDAICKFNPNDFLRFHKEKKAIISILLKRITDGSDYGEVRIDESCRIKTFNEKNDLARKCLINTGIYIFNKEVFKLMPDRPKFSLERDFFPGMAGGNIFGYLTSGVFIDIGTPQKYLKAKKSFLKIPGLNISMMT